MTATLPARAPVPTPADASDVTGGTSRDGHTGTATEPVTPAWERERLALIDQVEWLRGQVEAHQQEASEQRAHAAELARLLEREQHARASLEARQVLALPAPADPAQVEQPGPGAVPIIPYVEPKQPRRRPWWKPWG